MYPSSPYVTATARVITVTSTVYSHWCNIDNISRHPDMKSVSTRSAIFNNSQQVQITSKSKDVWAISLANVHKVRFSPDNDDSSFTEQSEASEALALPFPAGLPDSEPDEMQLASLFSQVEAVLRLVFALSGPGSPKSSRPVDFSAKPWTCNIGLLVCGKLGLRQAKPDALRNCGSRA
jgi:hypothetical protein